MKDVSLTLISPVLLVGATVLAGCAAAPESPQSSFEAESEIRTAVENFLTAFERLDWPAFVGAFEDRATVFFPLPEPAREFTGRDEFEPQFRAVFDSIRASNPTGPPYHDLEPKQLEIVPLASGVALVTFLLDNEERMGRRSLVLVQSGEHWKIRHLHASNVPKR